MLIFGFPIVLPIAIAAFWRPKICAVLMALSFFLVVIAELSDGGLRDAYSVGKQIAPTLALAFGCAFVASLRSKSPGRR
jgi:hypothetical protein